MKKTFIKKSICIFFFGLISVFAFADEKKIILGGKSGWQNLKKQENITNGKGRFGYDCIELSTNSFVFDEATDLLINFESQENPVSQGNYEVRENNLKVSSYSLMGKSAGLSRNIGGLNVFGKPGTFFGSQGLIGSFAIEFWLCPSISENGELILNWESSKVVNGRLVYQMLNCSFEDGHLVWKLSNIFDGFKNENGDSDVEMKGDSVIIPQKWSYHALSYNCENGCLEYFVDGITQDITYITSNRKEDGEVCLVEMGNPSELEICSEYTGLIDDIRILRRPYSPPDYQSAEYAGKSERMIYIPTGGCFETLPLMVSTGATLKSLKAELDMPSQTDIEFYVRSGDNYFNWTDSYPEWKPVENGQQLYDVNGLYFQVACYLYPDGNGITTPSVTSIELDFEEISMPLPPFNVRAKAGNESVTLTWNYSVDETTGGYYIYYGNRPGEYLGRIAVEGMSPIKIGNVTSFELTGLENGKIYYFAIATWSSLDDRIVGELSQEVFARPLERLK